ncbi:hypothetical protein [Propionibacterium cyclohexanicum]|uniref:hypothetical protein n=1 Tax=Propionibacterium cyclohexanicum TaxID=64702 RepID=UPI0015A58DB0|nr:hypothetical protein [Propionibacterium cyclohexanicum]
MTGERNNSTPGAAGITAISWAALAASIVASFGLGTALAGTIFGLAKRWALKQFVAW